MKRVAWLTDIHLNFLRPEEQEAFLEDLLRCAADCVLIGGDIGEAHDLSYHLRNLALRLACPIYFVLGNHDFYRGSIQGVRDDAARLCDELPNLHYLTCGGVVELTPNVGLVGHDGWADARLGDYERSFVMMNDYRLIEELARVDKEARWPLLMALGDEAAGHFRRVLPEALSRYRHLVVLTHVPPFREACWHEGRLSNGEWLPHFTCKAVGDALLEVMQQNPTGQVTVLCGHTHSSGEAQLLPNLRVLTGGAKYGAPRIQAVFEYE